MSIDTQTLVVSEPDTSHWHRLHGQALSKGKLKTYADDFVVEEQLGFELSGEGEHHLLWIEKVNTNTAFVAEQLAAYSGIALRDISYAGRKDKFARTRQYFSVYQGKHASPDWQGFSAPNIEILSTTRHNKKLRTGALKGNRFNLTIRDIEALPHEVWAARIEKIQSIGVPNYYGQQRFGEMQSDKGLVLNGNLRLGFRMAQGEKIKNRNKRSMAISALRSFLFNEAVSQRIAQQLHETILLGDALQLGGSNSYFVVNESDDMSTLDKRLKEGDVQLTGPLFGGGALPVKNQAKDFEQNIIESHPSIIKVLSNIGLKQERRPIMLYPKDVDWALENNQLRLSFSLPAGCFATSVVRELIDTD